MAKDLPLEYVRLSEQLSKLPEEQLQQIVKQSNDWAAYNKSSQLMRQVAHDMKEIPELPSEIPTDTNPLLKVEFPVEGGVLTWMENNEYPYRGYPLAEFVDKIDSIKKISRSMLSGLYHRLKNRSKLWFLTLLPGLWISKDIVRSTIYVFYRTIERFRIKKERYCLFMRELYRAMSLDIPGETSEDIAFRTQLRDVVCMILEFDNAYRFRAQDIVEGLQKDRLLKDPAGELLRLLNVMSLREKEQQVRDTWALAEYAIRFYFRFDKGFRKIIVNALSNLDLEKAKLSIEDKSYCVPRIDYLFGFQQNPTEDDKRIIAINALNVKWREKKGAIQKESTKAHEELFTRHHAELEKGESSAKQQMAELQALDEQFTKQLDENDSWYNAEKTKLKK